VVEDHADHVLGTFKTQREASIIGETHLQKLASMLHREHVCIEIGNPLLTLLRDS
jgi:hypothetical protein